MAPPVDSPVALAYTACSQLIYADSAAPARAQLLFCLLKAAAFGSAMVELVDIDFSPVLRDEVVRRLPCVLAAVSTILLYGRPLIQPRFSGDQERVCHRRLLVRPRALRLVTYNLKSRRRVPSYGRVIYTHKEVVPRVPLHR